MIVIRNRFDDRAEIEHYLPTAEQGSTFRAEPSMPGPTVPLVERLGRWIAAHPKQSLITALAAGAVLGWITKRR
jgi:hypothetical protein